MGGYREDRRTDPIPPVRRYGATEQAQDQDIHRQRTYEEARERLADQARAERAPSGKRFADLVKGSKRGR